MTSKAESTLTIEEIEQRLVRAKAEEHILDLKISALEEQIVQVQAGIKRGTENRTALRFEITSLRRMLQRKKGIRWPTTAVADLPISDYSKSILANAGITDCGQIPPTEKELMACNSKIGFAVIQDLKRASSDLWPIPPK